MRKQFMRYRLKADQIVGRANKSEVLSDELLQIEKHIEHVRVACQSTYKKLSHCMQSHGAGEYEKRLKRLSENTLAQAMSEASANLLSDGDSHQGLGIALDVCSKAQGELAKEKAMYEMFVDDHIVAPLQTLVETEIPAILKQREKLKRLVLDRDGTNQNYLKAMKAQSSPGVNNQQSAAKVDALKEEYDQAVSRMEQCKDQLITEMFEYMSKEVGHSQRIADFHAKQLDYHRRCVALLEKLEPEIKVVQEKTVLNSSFGRSLGEHLRTTEREIASPIEACVLFLLEYALKEEGIFRIAGGATKLKKIRSVVDGGVLDLSVYDDDVHAVAGALKQYLRELPDPLLTCHLHDKWLALSGISDNEQKLQEIRLILKELPPGNRANFRYLVKFCSVIAEFQEYNKMSASNLAVVLAPNLLWSNIDDIAKRMVNSNIITGIIEFIISNADRLFPGDIDFVATPNATSYTLNLKDSPPVNDAKPQLAPPTHPTISSPSPPTPSAKPLKVPNHNRNPSVDANSSGDYTSSGTLKKKQKSKAPPPPQTQAAPPPPKPQERAPLSLPGNPPPNNESTPVRPPTAAKRMSMRKPHFPPPPNPSKETGGEKPTPGGDGNPPVARPRPPVRKLNPHPNSTIEPPPSRKNIAPPAVAAGHAEPKSPPMPTDPPPPLPADVEMDLGASLTSELHLT